MSDIKSKNTAQEIEDKYKDSVTPVCYRTLTHTGANLHTGGLTKREYFAGKAVDAHQFRLLMSDQELKEIANNCTRFADLLLAELEK